MDFGTWFETDFLPAHLSELALDVVAIELSALGPAAAIFLSSSEGAFYTIQAIIGAMDYGGFLQDLSSHNYVEGGVALGNIVWDVLTTFLSRASTWVIVPGTGALQLSGFAGQRG